LQPPTEDEALTGQQRLAMEQLEEIIAKNELNDYLPLASELLEKHDVKTIVAAAIRSLTKEPDDTPVKITEERPLPSRKTQSRERGGYKGSRGGGRSFGGGRGYGGGGGSRRSSRDRDGRRDRSRGKSER